MVVAVATASAVRGAESASARVTHLLNRAEVQSAGGKMHLASQNDVLTNDSSLRTESDSALELTFDDGTFARLSRNTDVQMLSATHFTLHGGAMLLHVPQHPTSSEIQTSLISASTSGGTFALETLQTKNAGLRCRITVLEGAVRVCRSNAPDECTTVEAKHAFFASADQPLGASVKIDIGAWLANNTLITSFPPLKPALLAAIGAAPHANMTLAAIFGGTGTEFSFSNALGTINPANIAAGGNEVSPSEQRLTICHKAQTLTLPINAAEEHLRKHSGDSAGACR